MFSMSPLTLLLQTASPSPPIMVLLNSTVQLDHVPALQPLEELCVSISHIILTITTTMC